jgi:hypothetical protein
VLFVVFLYILYWLPSPLSAVAGIPFGSIEKDLLGVNLGVYSIIILCFNSKFVNSNILDDVYFVSNVLSMFFVAIAINTSIKINFFIKFFLWILIVYGLAYFGLFIAIPIGILKMGGAKCW